MTATRTPEQVTREIEREREQLALAVNHLRGELKQVTDVRALVRKKLPQLATVALVAAGVVTAYRVFRHRSESKERARLGRFTLRERS
jgi:hypothetical protein